jgi:galactokinase
MALKGFFKASVNEKEFLNRLVISKTLFFGRNFSPVDYLAILQAKKDQFLVIDEAAMDVKRIKSPLSKYKLLIMDSRVPRMGVEEELKQRMEDLKKGLELLSHKKQGASFRDYLTSDLVESMGDLPEEIRRRSMHVVREIHRVNDAGEALKNGDFPSLSKIFYHSHESLRDLYEVSCPEIDWLVKRAQELEGALGSRMTGQGFGGCTYTFIKESAITDYKKKLEDYERIFGFHPVIYEIRLATGARIAPGEKNPSRVEGAGSAG